MKKLLLYILLQFFFCNCSQRKNIIIIISANTEWVSAKNILQIKADTLQYSPYGEFFSVDNFFSLSKQNVIFFHGGWGKIDSAASTQWVISNLNPKYIINIGTAGGFIPVQMKTQFC
ncbi:hypothetical protein [Leptospira vanthielii]|uniref:Phosphorylase domain protein n=1 Tax=Leptospira vanthielii serovar Holland str. Waz Holland = ATCC 700522 TaxID=1218591 RepID=N1W984_9LEPT|nr:hypothetical protein [Leptospira vanthielii]EMY68446.1 phosphorylase domain protein [Leptospira vanthielii serovar Holland str. Waz Holland = ATCC 700522]